MSDYIIKTFHKIRVTTGKYTEFWFKEDIKSIENYTERERFSNNESFHACMKTYMLIQELEKHNILEDVLLTGLKNMKSVWQRSQYRTHLEFVSFEVDSRIILIEKI